MENTTEKRRAFIINAAYFAIIAIAAYLVLEYLLPWIMPFVVGYAISFALKPIVLYTTKHTRLNRKFVALFVLLVAYCALVFLLIVGGARLIATAKTLFMNLPAFYDNTLQPAILEINSYLQSLLPDSGGVSGDFLQDFLAGVQNSLLSLSSYALSALGSVTKRVPQFLLALIFSIMSSVLISMNYHEVSSYLAKLVPQKHRRLLFSIKDVTTGTVLKYLKAYLKLMCVTFTELAIGLSLLQVEHAILIALGIAIFDILPVLGTGGILIPWVVLSLLRMNFPLALGLALLYGLVTLMRYILEPRIVGSSLGLHPLAALAAIYIGFQWNGLFGMIFVPILLQVLVALYKKGVIHWGNNGSS